MIVAACQLAGQTGHQAGRALLAQLYYNETGRPLPPIVIAPGGKPRFADSDYHFSISHTKRHAFCVLSKVPVGLDAEEADRKVSPNLARKVLSSGEYAQYCSAPDPNRALLTFWVLKEALVKCSGEGLRGYPNFTNFSLSDPRVREMEGCFVAIITENEEENHAF